MSSKATASKSGVSSLPIWAWIFPVLTFAGILLAVIVVLIPGVRGIFEDREAIEENRETLARLIDKRTSLEALSEIELRENLRLANFVLPSEKPVYEFMSALRNLILTYDTVSVSNYELSPGILATQAAELEALDPGEAGSVETELSLSGPVDDIQAFLRALEITAPMVSVTEVSYQGQLMRADAPVEDDRVNVELVMQLNYTALPAERSDIEAPLVAYEGDFSSVVQKMQSFSDFDTGEVVPELRFERDNPFTY